MYVYIFYQLTHYKYPPFFPLKDAEHENMHISRGHNSPSYLKPHIYLNEIYMYKKKHYITNIPQFVEIYI